MKKVEQPFIIVFMNFINKTSLRIRAKVTNSNFGAKYAKMKRFVIT